MDEMDEAPSGMRKSLLRCTAQRSSAINDKGPMSSCVGRRDTEDSVVRQPSESEVYQRPNPICCRCIRCSSSPHKSDQLQNPECNVDSNSTNSRESALLHGKAKHEWKADYS